MAPGIHLEPETFYHLKNFSGLFLGGTDFEGILGVSVMTLIFLSLWSSQKRKSWHCYLETLNSHIHFSFLFTKIFSRQVYVCVIFCSIEVFPFIHFSQAVRNCHLIILKMEYPLEVIRSLLCNLA